MSGNQTLSLQEKKQRSLGRDCRLSNHSVFVLPRNFSIHKYLNVIILLVSTKLVVEVVSYVLNGISNSYNQHCDWLNTCTWIE